MKPINPNSLREPFDLADIDRMIESWRGTPKKDVPAEVQIIGKLRSLLKQAIEDGTDAAYRLHFATEEIAWLETKISAFHRIRKSIVVELERWGDVIQDEISIQKFERQSAARKEKIAKGKREEQQAATGNAAKVA